LVHARPLKSQSRDCAELVVVVRRGGGEGTAVRSKATDDGAVGWGGGRGVTDSGAVGGGGVDGQRWGRHLDREWVVDDVEEAGGVS
jgi:hypothetical protein